MAGSRQRYRLLIADDDPAFRETLRLVLEPYFSTIEAECGEQAVEIVESVRFDIALLDMHMRLLTGLETLRILKSINAAAPCILITAEATEQLRSDATAARAHAVLAKPVRKAELVQTVSTALRDAYQDPNAFASLQA